VELLSDRAPGTFGITWISVAMGRVIESSQLGGCRSMDKTIEGGWVAAIVKQ
jgi:hypothetical protein